MSDFIVYSISDPRTGYVHYVGKTSRGDIQCRLKEHLRPVSLSKNDKKSLWLRDLLASDVNPVIEELERFDSDEALDEGEKFYIEYLRYIGCPLTNALPGGGGRVRGTRMSEETRRKMSASHMGKLRPPFTAEHRQKLSVASTGRYRPLEAIEQQRESLKRNWQENPKIVLVGDQNGVVYRSVREAATATGLAITGVYAVLNGEYRQMRGYTFRYLDKPKPEVTQKIVLVSDQNGVVYQSVREVATATGLALGSVYAVLNGRCRQMKGYTFRYLDKPNLNSQENK